MPDLDPGKMTSRLNASDEFVAGRHGIARVDSDFAERFHSLSFVPASATEIVETPLPRNMAIDEIVSELKPGAATLAELFVYLHRSSTWPWSIFYLSDASGTACAVICLSMDGEWHISAAERPGPWTSTYRVYGRPEE